VNRSARRAAGAFARRDGEAPRVGRLLIVRTESAFAASRWPRLTPFEPQGALVPTEFQCPIACTRGRASRGRPIRRSSEAAISASLPTSGQCPRWGSNPHSADFKTYGARPASSVVVPQSPLTGEFVGSLSRRFGFIRPSPPEFPSTVPGTIRQPHSALGSCHGVQIDLRRRLAERQPWPCRAAAASGSNSIHSSPSSGSSNRCTRPRASCSPLNRTCPS
jgi:hypothetical protein